MYDVKVPSDGCYISIYLYDCMQYNGDGSLETTVSICQSLDRKCSDDVTLTRDVVVAEDITHSCSEM